MGPILGSLSHSLTCLSFGVSPSSSSASRSRVRAAVRTYGKRPGCCCWAHSSHTPSDDVVKLGEAEGHAGGFEGVLDLLVDGARLRGDQRLPLGVAHALAVERGPAVRVRELQIDERAAAAVRRERVDVPEAERGERRLGARLAAEEVAKRAEQPLLPRERVERVVALLPLRVAQQDGPLAWLGVGVG